MSPHKFKGREREIRPKWASQNLELLFPRRRLNERGKEGERGSNCRNGGCIGRRRGSGGGNTRTAEAKTATTHLYFYSFAGLLLFFFFFFLFVAGENQKARPLLKAWMLFVRWPQREAPGCFLPRRPSFPRRRRIAGKGHYQQSRVGDGLPVRDSRVGQTTP